MKRRHVSDILRPSPGKPHTRPAIAGLVLAALVTAGALGWTDRIGAPVRANTGVLLESPALQTCHDCVWEATEFCGFDALCVTGVPEMNHDCINDYLDFGYFNRDFASMGPNLSGDLNDDGSVDSADWSILAGYYGDNVPGCTPVLTEPDSCGGTLSLSFDPDPNNIVPTSTATPGVQDTLYLVADGWSGAEVLEFSIEHTPGIFIAEGPVSEGMVFFNSTTSSTIYQMIANETLFANGPVIVQSWFIFVTDSNPVTFELKPLTPSSSSSPTGVRWADSDLDRRVSFAVTNNAAINGTPPASGSPCPVDLEITSFDSPAEGSRGCDTLSVSYTVSNSGTVDAGSFRTSLRASEDNIITVGDALLASVTVGDLAASEDTTITVTVALPGSTPRGNVYLGVIADDLDAVMEDDETNNTAANFFSHPVPLINAITDIGNDQGRSVRIELQNSSRDAPGSPTPVLQYEAFRRIDALPKPGAAGPASRDRRALARLARQRGMISDPQILIAGWEFVGAVPAHEEVVYNMVAPTLADSTVSNGMHWSVFFMRAATGDPGSFFDSCPDSGYSLDDLPPNKPTGFDLVVPKPAAISGSDVLLSWDPNEEPDLAGYTLYRDLDPGFVPDESNRIAQTMQTNYTDSGAGVSPYTYKLAAVDNAGNESDFAVAQNEVSGVPGDDLPTVVSARIGMQNPVSESAVILFDLPVDATVDLRVYDVRGRLVRTAFAGQRVSAGRHHWEWRLRDDGGRRIAPGVYLHRFAALDYSRTLKVLVLR